VSGAPGDAREGVEAEERQAPKLALDDHPENGQKGHITAEV
jgi:hypothetical protein